MDVFGVIGLLLGLVLVGFFVTVFSRVRSGRWVDPLAPRKPSAEDMERLREFNRALARK